MGAREEDEKAVPGYFHHKSRILDPEILPNEQASLPGLDSNGFGIILVDSNQ